ncbi:MAG: hypothetical protein OXD49_10170 [Candidatus Poribacteria bacterium]|nr:hypothetical protein [Candidatus Poribacteria bacterium]
MILIDERFVSADHIQDVYVKVHPIQERYMVIIQLSGTVAVFGRRDNDYMTMQMAFELRRRIVRAIVNYKSSDKPEIQNVKIPTFQEVHPENTSENS